YKNPEKTEKLKTSIYLRLSIIGFFFIGCIFGGFMYNYLEIKTLLVGTFFLLIALLFDYLRYHFLMIKREKKIYKKYLKYRNRNKVVATICSQSSVLK